jgi:hypothetical protein
VSPPGAFAGWCARKQLQGARQLPLLFADCCEPDGVEEAPFAHHSRAPGGNMARVMNRSPEQLRRWAHEHLVYEAAMLMHVVQRVADGGLSDQDRNAFVESFAIHVRCLRDFLWSRKRGRPGDALASDFCASGVWEQARPALPDAVRRIEGSRNRIGREIVHLRTTGLESGRRPRLGT